MTVIFTSIPKFLGFLPIMLKRFNINVFYFFLNPNSHDKNNNFIWFNNLKKHKIYPLPADTIKKYVYPYFKKGLSDMYREKTNKLLSNKLIKKLPKFFDKNNNIKKKINIEFFSHISGYEVIDSVETWLNQYDNKKIVLICFSLKYIFSRNINSKNNKIYKLILPIDEIISLLSRIVRYFKILFNNLKIKKNLSTKINNSTNYFFKDKIALVTHKGPTYAKLYRKNVYYSDKKESIFSENNLLHFDYSNYTGPRNNLKWVNLEHVYYNKINVFIKVIKMSLYTLNCIRSFYNFFGWLYLILFYYRYLKYCEKISKYKNLKLVLIDYDFLCPKSLILAFESNLIKTVCTQDRFIAPLLEWHNFFYNYYLCSSDYVKTSIENSDSNNILVDNIIPVGLYRTDYFQYFNKKKLPKILFKNNEKFLKIITCFGYTAENNWYTAKTKLLNNWNANYHFLNDIYMLSKNFKDYLFVLRFKSIKWLNSEYFESILGKIDKSNNIVISKEYDKFNFSYDLCSNSDLIIAKYTSLVDECLSYGLPVLIHDYTHNVIETFSPAIQYESLKIFCNNYDELLSKTKDILSRPSKEFKNKNINYLEKYFILASESNVRKKINVILNNILSTLNNTGNKNK